MLEVRGGLKLSFCGSGEVVAALRGTMNAIAELRPLTHPTFVLTPHAPGGSPCPSRRPSPALVSPPSRRIRLLENSAIDGGLFPGLLSSGSSTRRVEVNGDGGAVVVRAWRWSDDDVAAPGSEATFAEGVELFNAGEYYACHDVLEGLWNDSPEPRRSILHGILQCAVGLYHLLHQNHRGAMVELGEGLTKLRRAGFENGPLHDFEREASAVLEFVYNTQLEHAACAEDMCITMDGSEQSYQLLGNFGAGEVLYKWSLDYGDNGEAHIQFFPQHAVLSSSEPGLNTVPPITVKVPILRASEEDLSTF